MPASVLNDRYWLVKYRLMPRGGAGVAELPLDDYHWFPLIDRAEHEAMKRQSVAQRRSQRRGRGL